LSEQHVIDQLTERLATVYPQVEPTQVARIVREEYAASMGGRSATTFPCLWSATSAANLLSSAPDRLVREPFVASRHHPID
jgi:hypothetical protein